MNKDDAIERMRELVDAKVPFLHQGRDFNGIDCVHSLAYAYQYEGQIPAYPRNPVNSELERELEKIFGPPILSVHPKEPLENTSRLKVLDILSMQYRGPIRHLAMIVPHISLPGVLSIAHADSMKGHVIEHILDRKWIRRIVKVWRP